MILFHSFLILIVCLYTLNTKQNNNKISYSVLNASTGSFLDAILAGIDPPIIVKHTLIITNIIAWTGFSTATPFKSVILYNILLVGNVNKYAITIPKIPVIYSNCGNARCKCI